ncbi:hypothetical protein KGQ20_04230 [Catenulispora sp. NF23]|uniref:IrrE N-terminal-like domain-containing protein n=1 Tax=Catenulispora pinistramenti TaxID=2705254 RepID=A0ABS5KJN1_9ACTN|nr:ImmA/IrrE family metallo-endopeptidase [Catenulispora pinistramenti]MBS2531972.1 hypothetical protein [Catenulispora pinistramenti]MBS2546240.1 hypothetical protein [Catenulispora pinistramenti]
MAWDPGEALRRQPELTYVRYKLPPGENGRYFRSLHAIVVDSGLDQAGRRCALTHELIHAETRDDCIPSHWLTDKYEHDIDRQAAARLISLSALISALLWTHDPDELAEELHVDAATLHVRLAHLSRAERAAIATRLTEAFSQLP